MSPLFLIAKRLILGLGVGLLETLTTPNSPVMSFTARPALLALILSALFTSPAGFAQNQEQEDEQEQSAQLSIQYPVDIQVDNVEIKKMLTEHLPLLAQQKKVALDAEQIAYLAETTPRDVQNMVRTEGSFNVKWRFSSQICARYHTNINTIGGRAL